jgi:hypothetical protein
LIDEDMDNFTKEWLEEFLIPIDDAELSNIDIIGSPFVTRVEHVGQSRRMKKKNKHEDIENIDTDEEDSASEKNGFGLLTGGGGGEDQDDGQGGRDEGENQGEGKATLLNDPPTKTL